MINILDCLINKNMRLLFLVLLLINADLPIASCMQNGKFKNGIDDKPLYFENLMDEYCLYYYDYPEKISQLIYFIKDCMSNYPDFWPEPIKSTIIEHDLPILQSFQDDILIKKRGNNIVVELNGITLLDKEIILLPCDIVYFIDGNPDEYSMFIRKFTIPRYFNKEGLAVIRTEELDSVFFKKKTEIQKEYLIEGTFSLPVFKNKDTEIPIHTFFEYRLNDGLFYFCDRNRKFESELLFWEKMILSLEKICKKNNISRIVFLLPEYLLP